ncbi:hypothetical protein TruAng_010506 [Truncatella angustata]|nr:hypothetical protein TruAng_010506 [Truncatella angustata]
MPEFQGRKRSRRACETCRELKRKCDGAQPCGTCVRFEYDCIFSRTPGRRSRKTTELPVGLPSVPIEPSPISPVVDSSHSMQTLSSRLRSLEANSGAAFLRRLALRIDANNAPRMHAFAWNAFLGTRSIVHAPTSRPIFDMISEGQMQDLANVYFERVDPIYGFTNRQDLNRQIRMRWANRASVHLEDAVLCGIAALGYLFTHVHPEPLELDLAESARSLLEPRTFDLPSAMSITAWLLRVTYLRLTDTPHKTWLASCILMHMVEAAGLHYERAQESILHPSRDELNPEIRKRLVAVAQHLNTWASFDMGRSRITLGNTPYTFVPAPPGDNTVEILELLPYSSILDPERASDVSELEAALTAVLQRTHTLYPSILAQCNLMLCLCRRLQSLNMAFTGPILDQILSLSSKGTQAAQAIVDARSPWHHMINVPFQVICVLLAIDTLASTSQLKGALRCLRSVAETYNTDATQEALRTASLLLSIHQKWNEKCASNLGDVLREYPVTSGMESQTNPSQIVDDTTWLDDLLGDLSTVQQSDLDRLLNPGPFWEFDGNGL